MTITIELEYMKKGQLIRTSITTEDINVQEALKRIINAYNPTKIIGIFYSEIKATPIMVKF